MKARRICPNFVGLNKLHSTEVLEQKPLEKNSILLLIVSQQRCHRRLVSQPANLRNCGSFVQHSVVRHQIIDKSKGCFSAHYRRLAQGRGRCFFLADIRCFRTNIFVMSLAVTSRWCDIRSLIFAISPSGKPAHNARAIALLPDLALEALAAKIR